VNRAPVAQIIVISVALIVRGIAFAQDTDLRELDVSHWSCLAKPAGTATQPDEQERNLMKNRNPPGTLPLSVKELDFGSFLKKVAGYDATLKATRRGDLSDARKQQLLDFENQIVSLTGWLVLAYPGLGESANCGDAAFHDWHLAFTLTAGLSTPRRFIQTRTLGAWTDSRLPTKMPHSQSCGR